MEASHVTTNVFYYNVNMWVMEDNKGLLHFSDNEGYAGNTYKYVLVNIYTICCNSLDISMVLGKKVRTKLPITHFKITP